MTEDDDVRVSRVRLGDIELAVMSFPLVSGDEVPNLSAAERDVLTRMLRGEGNADIARQRGTALRTVANQVASIFRKLGVSSRSELAARLTRQRDRSDR